MQSCHAAIEAANDFQFSQLPEHPHLVLIGVQDEDSLRAVQSHLSRLGIRYSSFHESDRDDELTAIATEALDRNQKKPLSNYRLLRLAGGVA